MASPHRSGLAILTVATLVVLSSAQDTVQITEVTGRTWVDDCEDPELYWYYDAEPGIGKVIASDELGISCMNGVFNTDFNSIQRNFTTDSFFTGFTMNVRIWFLCDIDPAERFRIWVYGKEDENQIIDERRTSESSCDGWDSIPYDETSWQGTGTCLSRNGGAYEDLSCYMDIEETVLPSTYGMTAEDDIILRFGVNTGLDDNEGWAISGLNFTLFGTQSPSTSPTAAPTMTRVDCKEFNLYLMDENLTLYEMLEDMDDFQSVMIDEVFDQLVQKVADYRSDTEIRAKSELFITGAREYASVNTTDWKFELCVTSDTVLFGNFTRVINDEDDLQSVAENSAEGLKNFTGSSELELTSSAQQVEIATSNRCLDDDDGDDDDDSNGFTWYFWTSLGFLVVAAIIAVCHFFIWKRAMSNIHTIQVPSNAYSSIPASSSASSTAALSSGGKKANQRGLLSDGDASASTGARVVSSNQDEDRSQADAALQAEVQRALMMQQTQVDAGAEESFDGPYGPGSVRNLAIHSDGSAAVLNSDDTEIVGEGGEFLPAAPVASIGVPGMTVGGDEADYRHSSIYEDGADGGLGPGLGPGLAGGLGPGMLATPGSGGGYDDFGAY